MKASLTHIAVYCLLSTVNCKIASRSYDREALIFYILILLGKVLDRVVIADILDDLAYKLNIVGVLALLDERTEHIAYDPAEILMTGVGQEAAAVGQHTYKLAYQTELRQSRKLLLHAVLLIVEPPS